MSERITQKEIRQLISCGAAINVTDWHGKEADERLTRMNLETIAHAESYLGCCGVLARDKDTGQLYAVPSRSSNMYMLTNRY